MNDEELMHGMTAPYVMAQHQVDLFLESLSNEDMRRAKRLIESDKRESWWLDESARGVLVGAIKAEREVRYDKRSSRLDRWLREPASEARRRPATERAAGVVSSQ